MNKQNWYSAGAVVLVVVLAGWLSYNNKPKEPVQNLDSKQEQPQNSENSATPAPQISPGKKVWEGVLRNSDNTKKGNLMIVTKERTIYLKTSRDFSALLDKNVEVAYEGGLESFMLGNITAK